MWVEIGNILFVVILVVGAIGVLLYFLNQWASKKQVEQQQIMEQSRQSATIYVIDKKRAKPSEGNLPKVVLEQLPKYYKFMKMNFVKAKIGPSIVTLICEKAVFEAVPIKKNVKVELAGMYIVNVVGMKSKTEMKKIAKEKKQKEKESKKTTKN